jgi:serine/threonine-protein kinase
LGTQGWGQAAPPAQPLQSFDATPAIAFEIGWDDEEFAERRPQVQALARHNTQRATLQPRISIERQPVAPPAVSSQVDLAADIARIRARPRVPLWVRTLVPGVALFAAVLFGVVIVFVEPSSAKPAAPPVPTPVSVPTPAPIAPIAPVLADGADANPAPAPVARPPAESQQSVRHVAARHDAPSAPAASREAASEPAARYEAPSAKPRHTEGSTAARDFADEPAPAAVRGGQLGMLRLNSRPWSQVFVDGRLIGNTPIMGVPLKAGEHRVELVNKALDARKTIQVKIKPDDIVTKIVLLED